jgi:hypothetical protein
MKYLYNRSGAVLAVFGHHHAGREIPSGVGTGMACENAVEVEHERHEISFRASRVYRID